MSPAELRFKKALTGRWIALVILTGLALLSALAPGRWARGVVLVAMVLVLTALAVPMIRSWRLYRREVSVRMPEGQRGVPKTRAYWIIWGVAAAAAVILSTCT